MSYLKIKNEIDLKELEKFGFEYTNEHEQFYDFDEYNNCILIHDRIITLRIEKITIFEDFDLSVIFDLIQAGLVEKVKRANMIEKVSE